MDDAALHGLDRVILDVLPSRTGVVEFYRRPDHPPTESFATEAPWHMVYLHRTVIAAEYVER